MRQNRFVVAVPQEQLDDLRHTLNSTRWPHDIDEKEMFYGTSVAYMMDLVG